MREGESRDPWESVNFDRFEICSAIPFFSGRGLAFTDAVYCVLAAVCWVFWPSALGKCQVLTAQIHWIHELQQVEIEDMLTQKQGEVLGHPLHPQLLEKMGVLPAFDGLAQIDPAGTWDSTWLIWLSNGNYKSQSKRIGSLTLKRSLTEFDDVHKLDVRQDVVHEGGIVHGIRAEIYCKTDMIASPLQWKLTSMFSRADGRAAPELTSIQSGELRKGMAFVTQNGKQKISARLKNWTSDWCLMEAVQRLSDRQATQKDRVGRAQSQSPDSAGNSNNPERISQPDTVVKTDDRNRKNPGRSAMNEQGLFSASEPLVFHLFESFSTHKPDQRLFIREGESVILSSRPVHLSRFSQLGRGTLPIDYWLGGKHRLLLLTTGTRAYIRDDTAGVAFNDALKRQQEGRPYAN